MKSSFKLNTHLLKRKVPNLTVAAKRAGLRPATVSNLTTGKIPISRAEVKTLVALSQIADCTLDELIIIEDETEKIETGIKTIDLFAPLVRGGTAGLVARQDMGQLVLLGELFYRMRKLHFYTILFMPNTNIQGLNDVIKNADYFSSTTNDTFKKLNEINLNQDFIIGVDRSMVVSGDLTNLKERIRKETDRSITFVIVDITGQSVDDDIPFGPLESYWSFDIDLVTRRMYPGINPISSTSSLIESEYLDADHLSVVRPAKKLLRRYRELTFIVNTFGFNKLIERDQEVYTRGLRLEAFLTQPFYIAEEVTAKAGEWVSLQETVKAVQSILDGKTDNTKVEDLMYIGALNPK
ncbi:MULTISPECIES: helix-turn-helix domain-containing protein [unclassified Virgibacillus]|uniref:helix-turn-helix domain-containing protein n=1 Tax=unclassified Virgibacillus TaxID=2620237 RepID=UPI0024DE1EDE|nr:helix-turn-helix domain-containing protein [Virgibacillus sp. LDC-1]